MKHQKEIELRLAKAKVKSLSLFSGFSDPISAPSSLPFVSDLISEISSSLSPCAACLPLDPVAHLFSSCELGGENRKACVGAITSEHDSVLVQTWQSPEFAGPSVTKALLAVSSFTTTGMASIPAMLELFFI